MVKPASTYPQVTVFNLLDFFADTGTVSLQALNDLPHLPSYLSPVGQAYRFAADKDVPRSIAFDYPQREAPPGYEYSLNLYYSPDDGLSWQHLPTQLDPQNNRATAKMPANAAFGQGIYALLATVPLPPPLPGWNLFSYPIPETRPVSQALASIDGDYPSVYEPAPGAWQLYDATVARDQPAFVPLVDTLATLDFAHSYWLYATQVITPYLGVPGPAVLLAGAGLDLPPATCYAIQVAAESGYNGCGADSRHRWSSRLAIPC